MEVGKVERVSSKGGVKVFRVKAGRIGREVELGDSILVNGVCQTVVEKGSEWVKFETVPETLVRTSLGLLKVGSPVNLEPALRMGDRISGHLVSGHIDCTGIVRSRSVRAHRNVDFGVQVGDEIIGFVSPKGSICLDGVSMTIKNVRGNIVDVTVIPFTLENTILKNWHVGTLVNVEVDMLAKYLGSQRLRGC